MTEITHAATPVPSDDDVMAQTFGSIVGRAFNTQAAGYFEADYGTAAMSTVLGPVMDRLHAEDDAEARRFSAELADALAKSAKKGDEKQAGVSARDLVEIIRADYRVGRSTDGLLFAVPTYPGSIRVAREVKSIRAEVTRRLFEQRNIVPGRDTLTAALETVSAYAADADPVPIAIRAAQVGDDRIVLDLGDSTGGVVEITADGWVVKAPDEFTPLFRRSAAMQPLPEPTRGGSPDALRELLGMAADDPQWLLVRGWLTAALFTETPRPLLWVTGPQGSGKSTRARMVLNVFEPGDALGKEPGRSERDDSTSARGRFLPSWDSITAVTQSTSDWLCRLVTGVTDDRRALFTDDDLRPVSFRRSGVATSLTLPPGLGADAVERIVLLELERVSDDARLGERGLWDAWHAQHPAILGAVLDDVVLALAGLRQAQSETRRRPRMADYADVLLALDRGLVLADDAGHLAAYVGGVNASMAHRAEDDPFTGAVIAYLDARPDGMYEGPSDGFLRGLAQYRPEDTPWWPTSAQKLTTQLRRASEALRHAGVEYRFTRTKTARTLKITRTAEVTHAG